MTSDASETGSLAAPTEGLSERAVIDVLPRAIIVTSPDGRVVLWNRRAEELYGWTEAEVLGRSILDVLVPVTERDAASTIMDTTIAGGQWSGDFILRRRDGESVRVFVVDAPILDSDGSVIAIVGASEDVTATRHFEQQAADLAEHLALALDAGGMGTWRWDMGTNETVWDAKLESLFGIEPGTFPGTFEAYVALLHPEDAPAVLATVQRAVEERSHYKVEHRVVWADGSVHWLEGKGQVTVNEFGDVTGTMGCVADITDGVVAAAELDRALIAAHEAAETQRLSAERLAFLGRVNDALAVSGTRAEVMRNVTRAAVPRLGDWCTISVFDETSPVPKQEVAHIDLEKVVYVQALQDRFPYDPDAPFGVAHVIRTGDTQFIPFIDAALLAEAPMDDEIREIVLALGLHSVIIVPLEKRGRILGAMQLVMAEAGRPYTEDDVLLAHVVASRIAATLENRRLDEHQRMIARTLQASLLPETIPEIPGLDIAVRYWAAGEGNDVGGDFYDVFVIPEGWAVVIGDVCGNGPIAASLTALARHTIRAAAWNGAEPHEVLRQLNHAVQQSARETFCTVLYCTLTPNGEGFRLTVTAGGHPLPIVRRANGLCEPVGENGSLLGPLDEPSFRTVSTDLGLDDVVVLYTDGLTDVPPPHDLSAEALTVLIENAAAGTTNADVVATKLGQQIEARLAFRSRDDDIALSRVERREGTRAVCI